MNSGLSDLDLIILDVLALQGPLSDAKIIQAVSAKAKQDFSVPENQERLKQNLLDLAKQGLIAINVGEEGLTQITSQGEEKLGSLSTPGILAIRQLLQEMRHRLVALDKLAVEIQQAKQAIIHAIRTLENELRKMGES